MLLFYKVWKLVFFLLYTHKPHNKVLLIGNNDIIFDPAIYYTAVSFFPVSPSPVKYFFTFVFLTSFYEKEKEIWKAWEIEYLKKGGFYGIAWDFNFQHYVSGHLTRTIATWHDLCFY